MVAVMLVLACQVLTPSNVNAYDPLTSVSVRLLGIGHTPQHWPVIVGKKILKNSVPPHVKARDDGPGLNPDPLGVTV
jgi:hypothetical protein